MERERNGEREREREGAGWMGETEKGRGGESVREGGD